MDTHERRLCDAAHRLGVEVQVDGDHPDKAANQILFRYKGRSTTIHEGIYFNRPPLRPSNSS